MMSYQLSAYVGMPSFHALRMRLEVRAGNLLEVQMA